MVRKPSPKPLKPLDRVSPGESVAMTVTRRPRWVSRAEFVALILPFQADPSLRRDLRDLAPDTTDDIPPR